MNHLAQPNRLTRLLGIASLLLLLALAPWTPPAHAQATALTETVQTRIADDVPDITTTAVFRRNIIRTLYPRGERQYKFGLAEKPLMLFGDRVLLLHGGCSHGPPYTRGVEFDPATGVAHAIMRDGDRMTLTTEYQRGDYFLLDAECIIQMGVVRQGNGVEVAIVFSGDPYRGYRTYVFAIPQYVEGRETQYRPRTFDAGPGAHSFAGAVVQQGDEILAAVQNKALRTWPNINLSTNGKNWFQVSNAGEFPHEDQSFNLMSFRGEIFGISGVIGQAEQRAPTAFRLDPQYHFDGTYAGVVATPVANKDEDYWPEGSSWTRGTGSTLRVEWPELIAAYETDESLILHVTGRGSSQLMEVTNPSTDRPQVIVKPPQSSVYFVRNGLLHAASRNTVYERRDGSWKAIATYTLPTFVEGVRGAIATPTGKLVLALRQTNSDNAISSMDLPVATDTD